MTEKSELRNRTKAQRKALSMEEVTQKSKAIECRFLESDIYKNAATIMLYKPIQNEVDTNGIISKAFSDGKRLVFPVTDIESGRISPYFADSETQFVKGNFSVPEPTGERIAKAEDIDVILVPGIVFDGFGNRIGFGKGCYDLFLDKCMAVKLGVCYDFQLCDRIPAEAHDVKVDYILSEGGLIRCSQTGENNEKF